MNKHEQQTLLSLSVDPEIQRAFTEQRQSLLVEYRNIRKAQDKVLASTTRKIRNDMKDKILYLVARQVYEDFDEILVLCANGLSTGAMKILRGMFERTVTVCYLQKHLDEIELYHKYFYVRRRKEMNAMKSEFPNLFSEESLRKTEEEYEAVKHLFQVSICNVCRVETCAACKRKRDNFSWIRKDIVTMARETENFGGVIYHGYYLPMQETHPTAQAITHRIKATSKNRWEYVEGSKPDLDEYTLMSAHFLVVRAVEVLGLHFNLRIKGLVSNLWKGFMKIWIKSRRKK